MNSIAMILVHQVLVMFILVAVGCVLFRTGKITLEGSKTLGNILIYVALPSVIVNSFLIERTPEKVHALAMSAAASFLCILISAVVSGLVFRKNGVEAFASTFPNPGFFGVPLILAGLPEGSLFYVASFIAFVNIGQWTIGVAMMTGEKGAFSLKRLLQAPFFAATAIGLFLFLTGIPVPGLFRTTVSSLASVNTAIAMFTIGVYLARVDFGEMLRKKRLYLIAAVRLLLIPLLSLAVLCLFRSADINMRLAVLIVSACPVGSNVAVYAQLHGRDYEYAVQTVLISTVLSIVTIPLIVTVAGAVF